MLMKVLRSFDLSPDGVKIVVEWGEMHVGTSIFVPCIDTEEAKKQLKHIFKQKNWQYFVQVSIENKRFGVRIWRTL